MSPEHVVCRRLEQLAVMCKHVVDKGVVRVVAPVSRSAVVQVQGLAHLDVPATDLDVDGVSVREKPA